LLVPFKSVTGYNTAAYLLSTFGFVEYLTKSSIECSSPTKLGWHSPSMRPLGVLIDG